MRRSVRWVVAVLVTAAAFGVSTWLCGAVVLPSMLEDPGARWGVAAGLGAALAALSAAWGYNFATRTRPGSTPPAPPVPSAQASGVRSVAVSGNPAGNISTGDTGTPPAPSGPDRTQPVPPATAPAPPSPGSVTASGERSIAINGNPGGTISTGDHHGEGPA